MTPSEIQNHRFDKAAIGGYKTEDVNAFLVSVSDYVLKLKKEKDELEKKLFVLAEKIEEYRADEESLRAALIGAQKLGDGVVRNSKEEANEIMASAQKKAESLVKDATSKAETMVSAAKLSIDTEAYKLNSMQLEVAKFKGQMLNMYNKHIELLNSIPYEEKDIIVPVRPSGLDSNINPPLAISEPIAEKAKSEDLSSIKNEEKALPKTEVKSESRFGPLEFGEEFRVSR